MKKIYTLLTLILAISFGSQAQSHCNPYFNYSANSSNVVQFNVTNPQNYPYYYVWDFGDGSIDSSATTQHQYNMSGIYNVTVYVDSAGIPCGSRTITIYVNYCGAGFIHNVNPNGTVNFTSQAYHPPFGTTLHWDFGDGYSSTQSNPSHTYHNAGTYFVTHTVTDTFHQVTCSFTDSVVVGNSSACNASYSVVKDTATAFGVILYNNSSNSFSHHYSWDFGDGNFGTGRTPNHHYQNFGGYLVCLTITDSILFCTSTFCDSVEMDSNGTLKSSGFSLEVRNQIITSINENEKTALDAVAIYPNPANTEVSIDLSGLDENVNIRLTDLSGRMILSENDVQKGLVKRMDLSQLSEGFYFLSIENQNHRRVEKIVIVE